MPNESVLAALRETWTALEPLGIPMAVLGGVALSAWNHARFTRDADLLIGVETSSLDAVLKQVASASFRTKRWPPILTIDDQQIVQLMVTPPEAIAPVQVDLLIAGSEYQKTALSRRKQAQVPGLDSPIAVLNCDDLILFKLLAGRVIDRADAAMLLRENRGSIEFGYLNDWLRRLDLGSEYAEIWREAFPDEPPPGQKAT